MATITITARTQKRWDDMIATVRAAFEMMAEAFRSVVTALADIATTFADLVSSARKPSQPRDPRLSASFERRGRW